MTLAKGLRRDVRRDVLANARPLNERSVRRAVQQTHRVVDDATVHALTDSLAAELQGFGPLEGLLADPNVTDIVVNGGSEVWIDTGRGMERTNAQFASDQDLRRFAQRLAASCGRRLDDACPYVDAPLAHGVRLHAVLPPLAERVSVSIRVPRHRRWSLTDLTAAGMVSTRAHEVLLELLQERRSFLITGGTASGKTTLLNAVLAEVPTHERLVLVEDTRELSPSHPHVVSLQTKPPNIEGAGAVTMRDLVRQTLRMRPDRLIIGEVRGPEIVDLLTAFNTGHDGIGTLHANGIGEVAARIEALCALGGLSSHSARTLMGAALSAVVHVSRRATGERYLEAFGTLGVRDDGIELRSVLLDGASARPVGDDGSRRTPC